MLLVQYKPDNGYNFELELVKVTDILIEHNGNIKHVVYFLE